jgi:uncharacterized protein (TIGR03000 family)
MYKKAILIPVILSLACLLTLADFAHAQRRGGGGGNRGGGWGGYGGGGWNSWNNNSWNNVWRSYTSPYYWNGGGYYGGRSSYYYDYPRSTYYYDVAPSYYAAPSTQFYYEPAPQQAPDTAQIRVLVPDPNARVWFDGNPTQQTGTDRLFHTPSLQAGVANTYRIRATFMQNGREMTQERVVSVTPGRMSMVDFNQAQAEPIPIAQQPAPAGELLEGRVIRTGPDHFVIESRDNRQVTVYTNAETRFLMNQNPAAFTDLRSGANISLNFTRQGDRHFATNVTIRP